MPLRCLSRYRSTYKYQPVDIEPGQIVDNPDLEAFVLNDSPASFEAVTLTVEPVTETSPVVEAEAIAEAPVDKALKAAPNHGAMTSDDHPGLSKKGRGRG